MRRQGAWKSLSGPAHLCESLKLGAFADCQGLRNVIEAHAAAEKATGERTWAWSVQSLAWLEAVRGRHALIRGEQTSLVPWVADCRYMAAALYAEAGAGSTLKAEDGNTRTPPPDAKPGESEAKAGAGPTEASKESVDARGEVTNPADPTAYVPAHEARLKYTPAGLVTTHKQFVAILADNPAIRRWHPQTNRLCVHLADWTAFVAKQTEQRDADGLLANPAEIMARTAEIRRKKSLGK